MLHLVDGGGYASLGSLCLTYRGLRQYIKPSLSIAGRTGAKKFEELFAISLDTQTYASMSESCVF